MNDLQRRKSRLFKIQLIANPGDRAILGLLAVALSVALIRWPVMGHELTGIVAAQAALLAGFWGISSVLSRRETSTWAPYVRASASIAVVMTLYSTLGALGLIAIPYRADAMLAQADQAILGFAPSHALQPYQTSVAVEFFSFVYAAFIPYIYLSLFLGCVGRPPVERERFLIGWIYTYSISYIGYLFVPAVGPVIFQANEFDMALRAGFFHDLVVAGIEAGGGPHGAFPSLHVGASLYLCLFDWHVNRLRALTYLPIVVLIFGATIFLRYHYVVDIMAGALIALFCAARWKPCKLDPISRALAPTVGADRESIARGGVS